MAKLFRAGYFCSFDLYSLNGCKFITAVSRANNEIENTADKFRNIDLASSEQLYCYKLSKNYVVNN